MLRRFVLRSVELKPGCTTISPEFVCVRVCACVCVCVCVYIYIWVDSLRRFEQEGLDLFVFEVHSSVCVCVIVCMYICMCVCVHIHILLDSLCRFD